jgi:imidazolonepropionase-like amidohydrolase
VLAVRGRALFDGDVHTRRPAMVLIKNGRIVDVDTGGAQPPDSAEVIDAGSGTLLPGLIDAHTHLAFRPDADDPVRDIIDVTDADLLHRMQANAARALAAGITTVRDLGDRRRCTTITSPRTRACGRCCVPG